jgi:tetratricopeptide (TPR) repeat protein
MKTLLWNALILLTLGLPFTFQIACAQETAEAEPQAAADEAMDLAKQAASQLQSGHVDDAIDLLESALEKDPTNMMAMFLGGQAYSRKGVDIAATDRKAANEPLRRGAELMRKLAELKPELSQGEKAVLAISVYNEGCCFAIDGDSDKALDRLEESIKLGFKDIDLLKNDSDFDSVRESERFKELQALMAKEAQEDDEESDSDNA